MGFPINPVKIPIIDAKGLVTAPWYRFFANIHKALGQPGDPMDESAFLGGAGSFGEASAGRDLLMPLAENVSMADLVSLLMQASEARNETFYLVSPTEPGKL